MKLTWLLLLLLVTACSEQLRIHTDFDRSIEIHRLNTYTWLDSKGIESRNSPIYYNELNDKRIKQAVETQLKSKGYAFHPDSAQLIVHYHIAIEDKLELRTEPYGYTYGNYWMDSKRYPYRYKEGTLIVDFMDSRNKNLIWRGWAVSVLDEEKLITEELINSAVKKIFESFPISATQEVRQP
jgi:hypothetical protein